MLTVNLIHTLMQIRTYNQSDCEQIADLFHGAVHSISPLIYSRKQLEAWAPTPPDYHFWSMKLESSKPYVAVQNQSIIGFIELEENGHIDCFYVHEAYQRQGVGAALFSHISEIAQTNGRKKLHVEASTVAVPFFLKRGFQIFRENVVQRNGEVLINYSMFGPLAM